jgi:RNA polymerase sigma-54 factor
MALAPRLELRQTQSLVMTPQLQQAIRLLQLTNLELTDFLMEEVEKNPLLEFEDAGLEAPVAGQADAEEAPAEFNRDDSSEIGADIQLQEGAAHDAQGNEPLDTDYDNVYNNDSPGEGLSGGEGLTLNGQGSISGGNGSFNSDSFDFQENMAANETLRDHLEAQLMTLGLPPGEQLIARYLIDMVNEAGYLLDDVAVAAERLECPLEDVKRVLSLLQTFDPVGVMARNLSECLALQLADKDRLDPAMQVMIDNLELLARRDLAALKRLCGVDSEDLSEMIGEIQQLNPKPGLAFGAETAQEVVPDVFLKRNPKGGWLIELNSDTLPKVLVNTRYYSEISGKTQGKDEKAFLADCYQSANWLVKALDQRARTILRVATELVKQQEAFFLHGVKHLKPLNLRAIAEVIEMHESTVSRVTANKYMATSRGVFEMKYFFTSSIASSGEGDAHSGEAVKQRIREMIDAEKPGDILSDDKIVEILRGDNIDIARRTVAKYREAMRISSSVQRRRQKNPPL